MKKKKTNKKSNKLLFWLPRGLAIIYILFISLFALDVFGEYNFPEVLVALFMHLIPNLILIALLIVAWKKELIGGVLFIVLGIGFTIYFNTYRQIITMLLISGPLFLIGALFLVDYYKK